MEGKSNSQIQEDRNRNIAFGKMEGTIEFSVNSGGQESCQHRVIILIHDVVYRLSLSITPLPATVHRKTWSPPFLFCPNLSTISLTYGPETRL